MESITHQGRDRHGHEENGQQCRADVELKDDATPDFVDCVGLVEMEIVDVDNEEHEAGPCCCELRLDRDLPIR